MTTTKKMPPRKGPPHALTLPLATETLGHSIRVINADGDDVVLVGEVGPETRRIADLFAAAPDLLEAAKDVVEQAERSGFPIGADLADSIRVFLAKAIAKAERR